MSIHCCCNGSGVSLTDCLRNYCIALTPLSRDPKSESLDPVIAVDTTVVWQAVLHVTDVVTVDLPYVDALGALVLFAALDALEIIPALGVLGLLPALGALGLLPALGALGAFSAFDAFVSVAVDLPIFISQDTGACLAHPLWQSSSAATEIRQRCDCFLMS